MSISPYEFTSLTRRYLYYIIQIKYIIFLIQKVVIIKKYLAKPNEPSKT